MDITSLPPASTLRSSVTASPHHCGIYALEPVLVFLRFPTPRSDPSIWLFIDTFACPWRLLGILLLLKGQTSAAFLSVRSPLQELDGDPLWASSGFTNLHPRPNPIPCAVCAYS